MIYRADQSLLWNILMEFPELFEQFDFKSLLSEKTLMEETLFFAVLLDME